MSIPDSVLSQWSHHYSGTAPKQAHGLIRDALSKYKGWDEKPKYDIFLQGSYKNNTNLHQDSDVDVVVQFAVRLRPRVAALSGLDLEQDQAHQLAGERWQSFRKQVLEALKATYGKKVVTSGRKSLKLSKGKIPASADVVVTIHCETGLAFYLSDDHRWVVSYPQQHHQRGLKKEKATNNRYKRTIRMFKVARNHLVENDVIKSETASSYFIECLLYNVPNDLFKANFGQTYSSIVAYLKNVNLQEFKSQNGVRQLFGQSKDLWSVGKTQQFVRALEQMWKKWPKLA
ncbi:nucleotidyltransferase [Chloroflexota bacterium]